MMIQTTMIALVATVPLAVGEDANLRVDAHGSRAVAGQARLQESDSPRRVVGDGGRAAARTVLAVGQEGVQRAQQLAEGEGLGVQGAPGSVRVAEAPHQPALDGSGPGK